MELRPEYLFDKGKLRDHQRAMEARTAKLVRPAQGLSEVEKERYIHDFICRNVRYDKLKKPYSHEIIGPLGQGVGVCEGIAKTVKHLCDALGVWCMVAVSEAAPERGIRYRHAWNIIRVNGTFYHLDATFDCTLGERGPSGMTISIWGTIRSSGTTSPCSIRPRPAATGGIFIYREEKRSFTKLEEVERRAAQAIRKKQPLIFHWRGGPRPGRRWRSFWPCWSGRPPDGGSMSGRR